MLASSVGKEDAESGRTDGEVVTSRSETEVEEDIAGKFAVKSGGEN